MDPTPRAPVASFQARPAAGATVRAATLAVLTLVIFVAAFLHYRADVDTTAFHPDESRWINRAHYLDDLRDPFGPTWNDYYLTRGQPPVGSYVMGFGLALQGVSRDTNNAWEYRRGGDWNVQNGMYPTPEELHAGRMTNVALGAIAVVIAFHAVRLLSNTPGGIVAAALLTFHPLQSWHNRLALADTALTLTLALLVLATILLLRRPGWFRAIAAGVLIGLGGANKLTPLSLAFVLAAVGAVVLVLAMRDNLRARLPGEPWLTILPGVSHLAWMLLAMPVIAGCAFVTSYPYLWSNPIERTLLLVDFRQNEMLEQARLYPRFQVENTAEALLRTWQSLSGRWSATDWIFTRIGLEGIGGAVQALDVLLALVGIIVLGVVALRAPLRSGHLVVGLLLLTQVATIIGAMRTDFERYYLPIVLAVAILGGTGIGLLSRSFATAVLPTPRRAEAPRRSLVDGRSHAGASGT